MPIACSAKSLLPTWLPRLRNGLIVAKAGAAAILVLLLLLPLNAQRSLNLSTGQTLTATVTPTTTLLHLGHRYLPVKRDNTVSRSTPAPTLKLVAELPGQALLLTDTYRSRTLGLSECQAGKEQFFRLVTLKPQPKESFSLKLASCRDNLELADNGLQWSPSDRTLTIRWLTSPANQPNPLILHIAPSGGLVH